MISGLGLHPRESVKVCQYGPLVNVCLIANILTTNKDKERDGRGGLIANGIREEKVVRLCNAKAETIAFLDECLRSVVGLKVPPFMGTWTIFQIGY